MPAHIPGFEFAAQHDVPIPYMERSRDYYQALGYPKPYNWAHLADVAFTPLKKPLDRSSITVITTAAPVANGKGDQRPGAPMNPAAQLNEIFSAPRADPPALGISHLHYDRAHTDGADQGVLTPLAALSEAAAAGHIGGLAPRFHGVPLRYSHRLRLVQDGPELLQRLRDDGTDLALLPAI